ncbi:hypothetical protein B0H12DRAFT_1107815 [Mycena haematopus]|nr:hypothetical protein B0H12DRAFT_1107815 [Mycena haematopus]
MGADRQVESESEISSAPTRTYRKRRNPDRSLLRRSRAAVRIRDHGPVGVSIDDGLKRGVEALRAAGDRGALVLEMCARGSSLPTHMDGAWYGSDVASPTLHREACVSKALIDTARVAGKASSPPPLPPPHIQHTAPCVGKRPSLHPPLVLPRRSHPARTRTRVRTRQDRAYIPWHPRLHRAEDFTDTALKWKGASSPLPRHPAADQNVPCIRAIIGAREQRIDVRLPVPRARCD